MKFKEILKTFLFLPPIGVKVVEVKNIKKSKVTRATVEITCNYFFFKKEVTTRYYRSKEGEVGWWGEKSRSITSPIISAHISDKIEKDRMCKLLGI